MKKKNQTKKPFPRFPHTQRRASATCFFPRIARRERKNWKGVWWGTFSASHYVSVPIVESVSTERESMPRLVITSRRPRRIRGKRHRFERSSTRCTASSTPRAPARGFSRPPPPLRFYPLFSPVVYRVRDSEKNPKPYNLYRVSHPSSPHEKKKNPATKKCTRRPSPSAVDTRATGPATRTSLNGGLRTRA